MLVVVNDIDQRFIDDVQGYLILSDLNWVPQRMPSVFIAFMNSSVFCMLSFQCSKLTFYFGRPSGAYIF